MSNHPENETTSDVAQDEQSPDEDAILEDASANSPARATGGAIDDFDENDFDDDFDDDFEEEMEDDYEFEHELIEGEVVETDEEEIDEFDEEDDDEEEEVDEDDED